MQWLARICVQRPVLASVIVLVFVVVGLIGYTRLPVDRFPKVDFPTVAITTRLNGATPKEVETQITDKIEEAVTDWWKTSYKLAKSLEEELPGAAGCASKLREDTTEFRKNMPVIQSLASKALKRRHWEALSELLGKNIDPEEDLTLQSLLDLDAATHIESIQEVTIAAEKEYNLERSLNSMMKEWESIEFEVKAYKDSGTYVVGGIDEIISTRRLVHIAKAYSIFQDRNKAIELCVARFDQETKDAFLDLYSKVDIKVAEGAPVVDPRDPNEEIPF